MDERILKYRVGIFVVASVVLAVVLLSLFGKLPTEFAKSYTLYVHFLKAPGVGKDTPVRKNGILIGRVSNVEFADENEKYAKFANTGGVICTVKIDKGRRIDKSEECRINVGLLGDAVLQFQPTGTRTNKALEDGDYVNGTTTANPLEMIGDLQGDLSVAVQSVAKAASELGDFARNLNDLVAGNEEQLTRIVGKMERTVDALQRTLENTDALLGNEEMQANLQKAVAELPRFLEDTRRAVGDVRDTVKYAQKNLQNLEGFTAPLGERGNVIVGNIDSTIARLDGLMAEFTAFGETLNKGGGTIGELMNNPTLYHNLNMAARNVQELTKSLRPIVDDVRVVTDKLARDPAAVIRSALKQKPTDGVIK